MIKQFFDRRGEKRSLSGAKTRLFNEVYRKIAKSECKVIFFSSLNKLFLFMGLALMISLLIFSCALFPPNQVFYIGIHDRLLLSIAGIVGYFILKFFITNKCVKFGWYDCVFFSFIFITLISQFWALNSIDALSVTFSWLFYYCVFKFVQDWNEHSPYNKYFLTILQTILIFNLSIVVGYLVYKGFSFESYTLQFNNQQTDNLTFLLKSHRNYIATYLILLSSVAWYYLIKSKKNSIRIVGLMFIVLTFLALLLIRSRGGLLALTCLFILYILFSMWNIKRQVLINAFVLLVSSYVIFEWVSSLQQNESTYLYLIDPLYGVKSTGGDERLRLWRTTFQLFLEKPIWGHGSGSWMYEYMKYGVGDFRQIDYTDDYFKTTHNVFLNILFCNGIIGITLFLYLMVGFPVYKCYKNFTLNTNMLVSLIALIGVLIMMQFYGDFDIRGGVVGGAPMMLFILIGIIIKQENNIINFKISNLLITVMGIGIIFYYLSIKANMSNYRIFNKMLVMENYESCKNILNDFDESVIQFSHLGVTEHYLNYQIMEKLQYRNQAVEHLEKQLNLHPYSFSLWYQLGVENQRQNYLDKAINCFEKALLYNCDYVRAKVRLYCVHTLLGNQEQAKKYKNEFYIMKYYLKRYQANEKIWKNFPKAVRKKRHYRWQLNLVNKFHRKHGIDIDILK